jgi:diguanylate cyclase (GGDEF)-like protein/PAS domain S-box-containing protein
VNAFAVAHWANRHYGPLRFVSVVIASQSCSMHDPLAVCFCAREPKPLQGDSLEGFLRFDGCKMSKMVQTRFYCWVILKMAVEGDSPTVVSLAMTIVSHEVLMAAPSPSRAQGGSSGMHPDSINSHRSRLLSVLFVHRDADIIDACVQELKKAQFIVKTDFVVNLEQCTKVLNSQSYDVVVAEHPGSGRKQAQSLQLLRQTTPEIPLLLLITPRESESAAQLHAAGVGDYVEQQHLARLPMAVRRVLNDSKLRADLEEARKALRHSQSLYRALVDNPVYGIYRCDADWAFLDVNQALLTMLGYSSKEELLEANREGKVISRLYPGSESSVRSGETTRIEPMETDWKRKDGTTLKARVCGGGVYDDHGNLTGYEIIAVDATEQRTLEDQLRRQASSDSLTGLGNHRALFEALQKEISRSERSGREFSLILLDLDGLKKINDQFGHAVGSRSLCRLAQILADCCRSIDTAARHGGDEFAVVLPETSRADATSVGQRICEVLQKDSEHPSLSVSIGVASYPQDADTIGSLLYAADKALYAVKSKNSQVGEFTGASVSCRANPDPAFTDVSNDLNAK